jgi:hypothetical protein
MANLQYQIPAHTPNLPARTPAHRPFKSTNLNDPTLDRPQYATYTLEYEAHSWSQTWYQSVCSRG